MNLGGLNQRTEPFSIPNEKREQKKFTPFFNQDTFFPYLESLGSFGLTREGMEEVCSLACRSETEDIDQPLFQLYNLIGKIFSDVIPLGNVDENALEELYSHSPFDAILYGLEKIRAVDLKIKKICEIFQVSRLAAKRLLSLRNQFAKLAVSTSKNISRTPPEWRVFINGVKFVIRFTSPKGGYASKRFQHPFVLIRHDKEIGRAEGKDGVYKTYCLGIDDHTLKPLACFEFNNNSHLDELIEGYMHRELLRLKVPNIPDCFLFSDEDVLQENIDGGNLRDYLDERNRLKKPLTLSEIRTIACNSLLTLAKMHELGFLYRDFKLENLLVKKGERGEITKVLVTDFGFTSYTGIDETRTPLVVKNACQGSPICMAPETWEEKIGSPEADIYGWGVTIRDVLYPYLQDDINTIEDLSRYHDRCVRANPQEYEDLYMKMCEIKTLAPLDILILQATHPSPNLRPTAASLLKAIEAISKSVNTAEEMRGFITNELKTKKCHFPDIPVQILSKDDKAWFFASLGPIRRPENFLIKQFTKMQHQWTDSEKKIFHKYGGHSQDGIDKRLELMVRGKFSLEEELALISEIVATEFSPDGGVFTISPKGSPEAIRDGLRQALGYFKCQHSPLYSEISQAPDSLVLEKLVQKVRVRVQFEKFIHQNRFMFYRYKESTQRENEMFSLKRNLYFYFLANQKVFCINFADQMLSKIKVWKVEDKARRYEVHI